MTDGKAELYRCVGVIEGTVEIEVVFEPRFDYARAETKVEKWSTAPSSHPPLHQITASR